MRFLFLAVFLAIGLSLLGCRNQNSTEYQPPPSVVSTESPQLTPPPAPPATSGEHESRFIGKWVTSGLGGPIVMYFHADGTGTAGGFVWGGGAEFHWQSQGNKIIFTNWRGPKPEAYGIISSDGNFLHLRNQEGVGGTYIDLSKEKE